ncbi:transmembrane protein 214 [Aricia agestis]|uniref:transmembrane protein 214 n=1 Tax=Aricia agestis TaxID=91739 RepID=UPI001C204B3E|nr:transmembrane protein 214 [Aricia agestis]XP_041984320.1 transmembrane protein 214 [Aricia agestis]
MSSGQWEVVGKGKKSQSGKVKNNKDEEKKPTKNGVKSEEIVPKSQAKSYYEGMEIDDPKKAKKNGDKKKKQEKKAEASKPRPPKSLEEAFEVLDREELANIIATNKIRFSNAPLVWLKEVANFLNSKTQIEIEDPTFSSYDIKYPLCIVPNEVKKILEKVLLDAGKANTQLFFDVTLTTLANDMSRGQLVNGHRLLLQMLALEYPEFCITSLPKSVSLRNSYQNRPPIGLTLLWAFGQGGINNYAVGLKAWQELFFPIIELKNYSKYIVAYLSKLLDRHAKMDAKVSQEQLLAMFDTVSNKKNSLSKEVYSDLIKQLIKYKEIYFDKSGNKLQVTFNQLMKKLPNQYLSGASLDIYNGVLVESLVNCLQRDDSCHPTWRQLFNRCSKQSATLIDYIDENWEEVSPKLKKKSLKTTILQFQEVCEETLKGKKKDEAVVKANKKCQDILDRMTSTRRFPWLWASFFLFVTISGLIAYDVSRVGGELPKSATGKILNDLGILKQTQHAWQKTLSTSARGYLWLETNAPIYYVQTVEFTKPYAQLAKDVFIITSKKVGILYSNIKDYVSEKMPVVVATIEEYVPGAIETVQKHSCNAFSTLKMYSAQYYELTSNYLSTKVFVGEWAPEKLQNKTEVALNATKLHMNNYLHWLREKIHVYSEIP